MNVYVPILVLGALALGFAVFSVGIAQVVGPKRYNRAKLEAYECGIEPAPVAGRFGPVPGEVLSDGDAVHHLRHRDRLPLPVGGALRRARLLRPRRDGAVHLQRLGRLRLRVAPGRAGVGSREGSTNGNRGKAAERVPADHSRGPCRVRPQGIAVARDFRPGMLRDRDDGHRRRPFRHRPLRHGGVPRLPAPGRPDDRGRPGQPEDGARCCGRSTTRWWSRNGFWPWGSARHRAACSTTTRSCRASTISCRWTSTCRAARHGRRCCCNAILELHEKIGEMPLGANRAEVAKAAERAALAAPTTLELKGLLR